MDDTHKAKQKEGGIFNTTKMVLSTKHCTPNGASQEAREENPREQWEQNARNSDSSLETQLSNWQVFNIWDVRLQQMGSQKVI